MHTKKQRGLLRSSVIRIITKLDTELKKTVETDDGSEVEEQLELLNDKAESLSQIDNELKTLLKAEDYEKEIETSEEYRDKIVVWRFRAKKYLHKLASNQNKANLSSEVSTKSDEESNVPFKQIQTVSVKLPKITIPKFYGDISHWLTFWNSFETAIHKNEQLDQIDKFGYLKAQLSGSALSTIEGFAITSENYEKAVNLLKDRFARKDVLINAHMSNLMQIPPLKRSNDVKSFREFFDNCQTQIRSLETLGVAAETFSSLMCPMLMKLLPRDLVFDFNKEFTEGNFNINDLLNFLGKQLNALERSQSSISEMHQHKFNSFSTSCQNTFDSRFYNSRQNNWEKKERAKAENNKLSSAALLLAPNIKNETKSFSVCVFCDQAHNAGECEYSNNLSYEEKKAILMKRGCCFKCLNPGHLSRFCKSKNICKLCGKKHSPVMCYYARDKTETKKEVNPNKLTESTVLTNNSYFQEVYLQTLIIRIRNNDTSHLIRVIIDSGSSKSYISKYVAEILKLNSIGEETILHGLFGGEEKREKHQRYMVNLSNIENNFSFEMEVMDQDKICLPIPKLRNLECVNKIKEAGIFLSDVTVNERLCLFEKDPNEVHLLLGADVSGKLITGEIKHPTEGLIAMNFRLGWAVMGKICSENTNDKNPSLSAVTLLSQEIKICDLWNLDSLGILDPGEKRNRKELEEITLSHFKSTVQREEDGRYKVSLPWLEGHPPLHDHKVLAEKRLKGTVKSLKTVGQLDNYEQVFKDWQNEAIIEELEISNSTENFPVHYLPHRAVFKENSTTKLRPVFDGSAHIHGTVSINSCLERGPNLIALIPTILNRFRRGKIGVVSDIRKAFLQISLNEQDRNFLRFLWWRKGNSENEIVYRHKRVVFGLTCSPFLLAATIAHHLDKAPDYLKLTASKLKESMYVDNCVTSVDTDEELNIFRQQSVNLLSSAQFDLRGWQSNSKEFQDDETRRLQTLEEENHVSVLGLFWNIKDDTLSCECPTTDIDNGLITKRKILSLVHKIFDPIGFTCSVTLIPKLLLQECWKLKSTWDSKLPDHIVKKFEKWKRDLIELKNLKIPRKLTELPFLIDHMSLHVFCDACKTSYATCIFLRVEANNAVSCQLVAARSRVAPLKGLTIPRLELLACTIGARLGVAVKNDLHLENIETAYWSDSMDALYWLKKDGPWNTFVSNRVLEIKRSTSASSWKFVPGTQNPADLPSRGCSVNKLIKEKWHEGPLWLRKPKEYWPNIELVPNIEIITAEKKKTVIFTINNENQNYFDKFSSYWKLLRITGWIYRFFVNAKKRNERTVGELNNEELKNAEQIILKCVQKEAFSNERDKRLDSLKTFVDEEGLIRIKTKIFMREDDFDFRVPVVLPSNHVVVKNLIFWKHTQLGHGGVQLLMSTLRENYWILKSRKTIRNAIKSCVICKRFHSKPPHIPEGLLPKDRVKDAAIFEIVGVDLAGPLLLKDGKKTWILIVTCAVFRAVHLELLSSLSTENFILGLRRFISRRGRPSVIYSDNGSNFVGTQNLLKSIDWEKLKTESKLESINWNFIPPSAPWWGGFWERLVGMMKRILRKVLGRSSLNYEELVTVLCDCESLMNSRPLTYVSDDAEELSPITPLMFLQEIRQVGVTDFDILDQEKFKKRLAYRNRICQDLRKRFRTEYLGQLRETSSKNKTSEPLQVGDVVIIWNDNLGRLQWPLGRILELFPSKDGLARTAKLQTKSGIIIRPVKKLCPLEVNKTPTNKLTDQLKVHTRLQCLPQQTRAGRQVHAPDRYEP